MVQGITDLPLHTYNRFQLACRRHNNHRWRNSKIAHRRADSEHAKGHIMHTSEV
jgi:hypothetical protein